jgi:hypothetical protein
MRTSIWYHTADRQPDKSGYYMGFRTVTLADDTCGVDYFYWNRTGGMNGKGEWRTDSTCHSQWANVYYWTESDPEAWVDADPPVRYRNSAKQNMHPAEKEAFEKVQQAIEQYQTIKALCEKP